MKIKNLLTQIQEKIDYDLVHTAEKRITGANIHKIRGMLQKYKFNDELADKVSNTKTKKKLKDASKEAEKKLKKYLNL
ncbi:MAG: hypothetical protein ACOCV1_00605 [Bacillota bacterium]